MTSVSAQDLTKTYYCKYRGCQNESRSPVGKYSYCVEHMGAAATSQVKERVPRVLKSGTEAALRDLLALAKRVDKAKAADEKAQRRANDLNRIADGLEQEYKDALAEAARGAVRAVA